MGMDYRGPDIKADTEDLWKIAVQQFPSMANVYQKANVAVHASRFTASSGKVKFIEPWLELHAEIELALADDATTLHGTAEALVEAARSFAEQDQEAAEAIAEASEEVGDEVPRLPPVFYPPKYAPTTGQTEPQKPEFTEEFNKGEAPTAEELRDKAKAVDEAALKAAYAEMSAINPARYLPEDWVETDNGFSVEDTIESFTESYHPLHYQNAIGCLESISNGREDPVFNEFNNTVEDTKLVLNPDKWAGDAARTFTLDVLNAYTTVSQQQTAVIAALAVAAKSYQESVLNAYIEYDKLLSATGEALEAIIRDAQAMRTKEKLAALSLAGGIWSAFLNASGAGVAAGLLNTGVAVASAGVEVGEAVGFSYDRENEGDYTSDLSRTGTVLNNAEKAFSKIVDRLQDFDDQLAQGLKTSYKEVEGQLSRSQLRLPRPAFIDNPSLL